MRCVILIHALVQAQIHDLISFREKKISVKSSTVRIYKIAYFFPKWLITTFLQFLV